MSVVEIITKFHVNRFLVVGAFLSSSSSFFFSFHFSPHFRSVLSVSWFSVSVERLIWKFSDCNLHFVGHITNHSDFFSRTRSLGRSLSIIVSVYIKTKDNICVYAVGLITNSMSVWKLCKWKTETDQQNNNKNGAQKHKTITLKSYERRRKKKKCKSVQMCILQCITVFRSIANQTIDRW